MVTEGKHCNSFSFYANNNKPQNEDSMLVHRNIHTCAVTNNIVKETTFWFSTRLIFSPTFKLNYDNFIVLNVNIYQKAKPHTQTHPGKEELSRGMRRLNTKIYMRWLLLVITFAQSCNTKVHQCFASCAHKHYTFWKVPNSRHERFKRLLVGWLLALETVYTKNCNKLYNLCNPLYALSAWIRKLNIHAP